MFSILNQLSSGKERIESGVVYVNEKKVGLVVPSLFEGRCESGKHYVSGPKGVDVIKEKLSDENLFSSLIKVGGILFGLPDEVDRVSSLLEDHLTSRTASYYCCVARNCAEVLAAFDKKERKSVIIVGCGGIGSLCAMQIAGAGIKEITIIDPDTIEESNFNRQFFWSCEDVGKYKAEVLRDCILRRYGTDCRAIKCSVLNENLPGLVDGYDAVILSADEPPGVGQALLEEMARDKSFLMVGCGYSHHDAVVRVVDGRSEEPSLCPEDGPRVVWSRNQKFIGPSFGPTNVEIAGMVASLVIHNLCFPQFYSKSELKTDNFSRVWRPVLHGRPRLA